MSRASRAYPVRALLGAALLIAPACKKEEKKPAPAPAAPAKPAPAKPAEPAAQGATDPACMATWNPGGAPEKIEGEGQGLLGGVEEGEGGGLA